MRRFICYSREHPGTVSPALRSAGVYDGRVRNSTCVVTLPASWLDMAVQSSSSQARYYLPKVTISHI